jgi:hypothetical protein
MGYYSNLDILVKENPNLSWIDFKPARLPITFEYITDRMTQSDREPIQHRTRQTPGTDECCLWPGCWVKTEWLRACIEWTYVPGWNTRVRFIGEEECPCG